MRIAAFFRWARGAAPLLAALSALAVTLPAHAGPEVDVRWRDGHLTVRAAGVPLAHVLREVERQAGVAIEGGEALTEPVTIAFAGLRLRPALHRLLGHRDVMFVEEESGRGEIRLARVRVFGATRPGRGTSEPVREDGPSGPGPEVVEGEPGTDDEAVHQAVTLHDAQRLQDHVSQPAPATFSADGGVARRRGLQ